MHRDANLNNAMKYLMVLDGMFIEIEYFDEEVKQMLDFLLLDLSSSKLPSGAMTDQYVIRRDPDGWCLFNDYGFSMTQKCLSDIALPFLNLSITSFARDNLKSLSLHAGLMSDQSGSILLPGAPFSGKTNACLWLSHLGMFYHSDEMVALDLHTFAVSALTRPYTLKRPLLEEVRQLIPHRLSNDQPGILESSANVWISHRLINPVYQRSIPALKSIVFLVYTSGQEAGMMEISRARAGMELMRCHVRSQRLADHGFSAISSLVAQLPVYMVLYNSFEQLGKLLEPFIDLPVYVA